MSEFLSRTRGRRAAMVWLAAVMACALVVAVGQPVSHGAVILSDTFTGAAGANADTTQWDQTAPAAFLGGSAVHGKLDGAGNLSMPGSTVQTAVIAHTSFGATPTVVLPLRLTVDLTSFSNSGMFGLHQFGAQENQITLRDDLAPTWVLRVANANAVTFYNSGQAINTAPASTGVWTIDWTPAKVIVSLNSILNIDTSITPPMSGGGGLPTVALRPFAFNYNGSGLVDSIAFESIPEPATSIIAMVGVGAGFVLRGRRKW